MPNTQCSKEGPAVGRIVLIDLLFFSFYFPFCGHLLVTKQVTSIRKHIFSFYEMQTNAFFF